MRQSPVPGPYIARNHPNDRGDYPIDCGAFVGPDLHCQGGTLATVHRSGVGKFDVERTAALLAAAPDLLRELRALLIDCPCGYHRLGIGSRSCRRCEGAMLAIAKAETPAGVRSFQVRRKRHA
jgi:hypothetical protein